MLQQNEPEDYVLATGTQYSVRELCELAFKMAGHPIRWQGSGIEEEAVDTVTGQVVISISEKYYRPTEVETLLGDPTKAKEKMGWKPEIPFVELIYDMMNHDFQMYGLALPESAKTLLPGGKCSKEFAYPDLQRHISSNAVAPEVSMNSPTNSA